MNRFDRAMRELRRETPTAGLENARAQFIDRRGPNRFPRLLALGVAAGAVALAPFALRTPAAATMTLAEVRAAAETAPRLHSRWYSYPSGREKMHFEQWQDGPRFRHDFFDTHLGKIQHTFDGVRGWSYFESRRYVTVTRHPQFMGDVSNMLQKMFDGTAEGGQRKELSTREILVGGKRMREITFDRPTVYTHGKLTQSIRSVWQVDPEAKRPYALRTYRSKGKGWEPISRATFEYPDTFDDSLFQLRPAQGETLFDKDEERRALPDQWRKGLGSQTVGGQTIVLRDVVLGREGSIAVIWTGGGRFKENEELTITDSTGKRWKGLPYFAYYRSPSNDIPESRLTKIEGMPNRMVLIYGIHGVVASPVRVEVPVIGEEGRRLGTAKFKVAKVRSTDTLFDLTDRMGIAMKTSVPARAIQR